MADQRAIDEDPITEIKEDITAASESIQEDASRIDAIEAQKAELDAEDPAAAVLSREAEELSRDLAQKATAERTLTEEITED